MDRDLGERLALRACPLAPDVALDTEHTRHVAQLLGHVLAHALHLAAALAHGGFGLVADLAPRQVGWQRRALGNLLLFNLGGRLRFLQRIDLRGHGRQVGLDLVFEQALLFGVEAFGLSRELHALQERVLVREFVQQRALVAQLRHEARGQLTQLFCAQALQEL